ncbi:MAG TPA: CoA pyrophosphatase [Prolixibacteraceae bacterium]|nr:CoA pyrophosphatase [Prolixibacteraceae bacterium]
MYSTFLTYLSDALRGELLGIEAHQKMLPPGRRLKTYESELSMVKPSGVLLLLFPDKGQIYLCLIKRPSTMTHHPGQISFPGGKVEKEDLSAEMAALREAQEEVGIDPSFVRIIGKLSELYVEVSKFLIHPFIAWADEKPDFIVNKSEVDELILLPLNELVANETIMETDMDTVTGQLRIKYYPFDSQIIWGATAMILSELIEILKKIQDRGVASDFKQNIH